MVWKSFTTTRTTEMKLNWTERRNKSDQIGRGGRRLETRRHGDQLSSLFLTRGTDDCFPEADTERKDVLLISMQAPKWTQRVRFRNRVWWQRGIGAEEDYLLLRLGTRKQIHVSVFPKIRVPS